MKKTRIVGLLLVFVLVTSCFVGGTFAKYTSKISGTHQATVAKWDWTFTINDIKSDESTSEEQTLNLFLDTELMDLVGNDQNVGTTADDAIHEGLIAPGVGGQFEIKVLNASEVDAVYTIVLTEEENETLPIEYSLDNKKWYDDFTEINADANLASVMVEKGQKDSNEITVYWRWAFEPTISNNAYDTAFGVAAQSAADTATITVTITATQVD